MYISLDGKIKHLQSGDTILIQPGAWHSFWADEDCIFEEISTTHYNNDSFYKDKIINKKMREERKHLSIIGEDFKLFLNYLEK